MAAIVVTLLSVTQRPARIRPRKSTSFPLLGHLSPSTLWPRVSLVAQGFPHVSLSGQHSLTPAGPPRCLLPWRQCGSVCPQCPRLKAPSGCGLRESALAYCDAGGGAGADAVHFGEGLSGAEALALVAAQGLPVGFGQVPGLLLLVASMQLVQGVFYLLHHCLVVVLQA